MLLRGLLFTPDGERLVPSYTVKKGKTYRYYSPIKHRRFGAWASQHGPLPAAPIEELVTQQIVAALSAPHIVQSVWDRLQPAQTCRSRRSSCRCEIWLAYGKQLFPHEQCRLAQLLIERVVIADGGLEIIWRDPRLAGTGRELAARHHRCGIAGNGSDGGNGMKPKVQALAAPLRANAGMAAR